MSGSPPEDHAMLVARAWAALDEVMDPEVPVLSIIDLGIVRDIEVSAGGEEVTATITPTYSGCPALAVIEQSVGEALRAHFAEVEVRTVLAPAWTTDWMTERGRTRLREYGIAPPGRMAGAGNTASMRTLAVIGGSDAAAPTCPRCCSADVEQVSRFGSTACKALWRCRSCREPFDQFKAI